MSHPPKYPSDNFTETDVLNCLQSAGKRFKNNARYILTQCPTHDDAQPSAQIYKDDWFVNCHSGCGRFHITKAFPELRPQNSGSQNTSYRPVPRTRDEGMTERKYTTYDLMDEWKTMPAIPRDHNFKGISLDVLDSLGWRWDEPRNSYFIPYFSRSKTSIPFAQWRHLSGDRRFTMLKDAKPTCYGTWNLEPGIKLFVVEGASDCAVLEACAVPWIGLPSASSGELMVAMATFCKENNIQLLYAGDNDEAGDKLKAALESVMPYRVKQPPKQFKDWGEFFIAKGFDVVHQYCYDELFPKLPPMIEGSLEHINSIMPGSREISATDLGSSKETSSKPAVLF